MWLPTPDANGDELESDGLAHRPNPGGAGLVNPNVLLMTLVIALEPIPLLGGVLLLTAERGRPKAIAFLLGWALALALIGIAVVIVGGNVSTPSDSTSSNVSAAIDVVLGLALCVFALTTRTKARRGGAAATPGWMKRLDTMAPGAAFFLGMFLPPYLVAAAVANEIIRQNLDTSTRVVAMALFVVVGSIGVLIPIMVTVLRPSRSDAVLASWRAWLQAHWQVVMTWLLMAVGAYLVIKGISEFSH
jgi:Sap, sulfolipid-1-addressing protein